MSASALAAGNRQVQPGSQGDGKLRIQHAVPKQSGRTKPSSSAWPTSATEGSSTSCVTSHGVSNAGGGRSKRGRSQRVLRCFHANIADADCFVAQCFPKRSVCSWEGEHGQGASCFEGAGCRQSQAS